ncbi:MAG: hypothetical protein VB131_07235 [Burkholderia gladioli]
MALLNELAARAGTKNPEQFAKWFDAEMGDRHPMFGYSEEGSAGAGTEGSGKWGKNFNGRTVLKAEYLTHLGELFPDAEQLYRDGPERLWTALWCPEEDLWSVCGTVAHFRGWPSDEHLVFAGAELTFDESLYNIECSLLTTVQYAGDDLDCPCAPTLKDLARAIALWRMHQRLNSIARTEGVGAYRCVYVCFTAPAKRLTRSTSILSGRTRTAT